jgi:uncharacterized BrkB/YihY/UPF0761 family membrane protein
MSKGMPVIFTMLAIVVVSLTIVGIAWYYGESDWTWIAQTNALLVLLLMVLGIAFIALFAWLKRR